jgi:hypothetical protein
MINVVILNKPVHPSPCYSTRTKKKTNPNILERNVKNIELSHTTERIRIRRATAGLDSIKNHDHQTSYVVIVQQKSGFGLLEVLLFSFYLIAVFSWFIIVVFVM